MTMIVCIDNKNGMMFGGRRQSTDAALRKRVTMMAAGRRLLMSAYSARQFDESDAVITIDEHYGTTAADDDICFVENGDLPLDKADTLILYRWNRRYPADRYFDHNPIENGFSFAASTDFRGTSHERITEEIYRRKEI